MSYHFGNNQINFYNFEVLRVIAKSTLRSFWEKHADCEQALQSWYREAEKANWRSISELKMEYPSASILKDNRLVFNIKGNGKWMPFSTVCKYSWLP